MLSFRNSHGFCVLFLLSLLVVGCSGGPKYEGTNVTGNVTLGGQPLEKGTIQFAPIGTGAVVSADILNGKYKAERVALGKSKVVFNATKETGKMITEYSTPYPEVISIIPQKYRDGLDTEITKETKNLDFSLESQ